MKTCTKCSQVRPLSDYQANRRSPDGLQQHCRPCQLANVRGVREARRDIVRQAKNVPCADCGQSYPSYVMDFDHRDPSTKMFELAKAKLYGEARIRAEIAKCDVVCANCHRARTYRQGYLGEHAPSLKHPLPNVCTPYTTGTHRVA